MENEKLTIQHLKGYLGTGLKYYLPLDSERISDFTDEEPWRFTHNIYTAIESKIESALEYEKMYLFQERFFICVEDDKLFLGQMKSSLGFDVDDVFLEEVKPILYPLSSLTKEIEVNSEKFVPLERLNQIRPFDCTYLEMQEHIIKIDIEDISYWLLEKLYEWHFDIHGLIEKGLAISITTLK